MNRIFGEFIGTFFLVLIIGMAGQPLAIAGGLMALIYALGPVCGAHFNPAVTFALWLRGKCSPVEAGPYVAAQLVAAAMAAGIILYGFSKPAGAPTVMEFGPLMLAEVLFTFLLVLVILQVATTKKAEGNQYFGLAIGLVVLAGAVSVGPISGAAFNPAVVLGASIFGALEWSKFLAYMVANFGGAALAVGAFWLLNPDEQ